jgi:hypothetical protein
MQSSGIGGLSITACAAMCLSPSAQAKPVELAPVTPWHVDWTDRTCVLDRGFGSKEALTVLRFERVAPTSSFQLSLLGRALGPGDGSARTTVRLGFGTPKPTNSIEAQLGTTHLGTPLVTVPLVLIGNTSLRTAERGADTPPVTPADEAAVRIVSIAVNGRAMTFLTGPMDHAFAALRKCTDDLVRTWGLDPVQQSTLSKPVEPTSYPGSWLKSNDYPAGMLMKGAQALVAFRLMVDIAGLPTACEIDRSYGDAPFQKATCRALMLHARFRPALDAKGAPIASYYINTVRWIIG